MNKFKKYFISKFITRTDKNGELLIGIDNHRRIAKWINKISRKAVHQERKRLFDTQYNSLLEANGTFDKELPKITDGWLKFDNPKKQLPYLEEFINAGRKILDQTEKTSDYKSYFKPVETYTRISEFPEILQFATSSAMLKVVGDYLGDIPVLKYINVILSPPVDGADPEGSQMFHMDVEDTKVARILVYIDDVDEHTGPFSFFPASLSKEIKSKTKYGSRGISYRLPDEEAYKFAKKSDLIVTTGKSGDIFICDTSNCLHYGSRGQTKPRKLFMLSYTSDVLENYHFDLKQKERAEYRALAKPEMTKLQQLVLNDLHS